MALEAMLGYSEQAKAYRLWDFQAKKVITSIHVVFEERQPAFTTKSAAAASNVVPLAAWEDILPPPLAADLLPPKDEEEANDGNDNKDDSDTMPPLIPPPAGMTAQNDNPPPAATPTSAPPTFLDVVRAHIQAAERRGRAQAAPATAMPATSESAVSVTTDDPSTYEEAMSRPDAPHWIEAMKAENTSLTIAHTYDVVPLPKGVHAIGGKWVFRTKRGPDGKIIKYKARWVAQGFTQKYGIDYHETFAPVARFDSIRALLSLVAHHDWELHQMDVRSAYLNGELEEELYISSPPAS